MEYIKLGSTNLTVSRLGIGAIPLQRFDEKNAYNILTEALDKGSNFIDTARGYTVSEELLGAALEKIGREKFIVATKSMARTYEDMKKDIEISLGNLRTDYIDLYQTHLIKTSDDLNTILSEDGAMKALLEAKQAGKIKHIGFSAHKEGIAREAINSGAFETIQYAYNYIESGNDKVFKYAKAKGLGTIVMKPVCGGATDHVDLSLRFILDTDFCDAIIPGVDNAKQFAENAKLFEGGRKSLTDSEIAVLQEEKDILGNNFCRKCEYCMPCPEGIDIPTHFIVLGYYKRYDLKDWAKQRYSAFAKSYKDCTGCGQCMEKCPYDLKITDMLEESYEMLGK